MKCFEMLTKMEDKDWEELIALKSVISYNPASVHPDQMEKFTELFVRSLEGKGETSVLLEPSNY
jgi:hypothetical protein